MLRLASWLALLLAWPLPADARAGAVAAEHRFAAEAGAETLRLGGSAVDAAVAAAAAGCIVHASSCGVGGGGFALGRLANGTSFALDFRERAPEGATQDRYLDNGVPRPERLQHGGLAVAVPGEVAGWEALHARFGRLPLSTVLKPAIRLARDGFSLDQAPHLRHQIERSRALLEADAGLRAVFLQSDGQVPGPGFRIVQADLARTLEAIGAHGAGSFYGGPVASAIVAAVQGRGGVLTARDLSGYRVRWRKPLVARYRGRSVITVPPPASGGIVLVALGLLAGDDPAALAAEPPRWLHLLADVMVQSFADRARWYGDPDFNPVPVAELLAPARLARLRAEMSARQCPEPETTLARDAGTANVSVVDGEGNAVALTTTINTGFGAGIMAAGTGVVLNNEMDDFAVAPGVPNVYGLVGSAANSIAPGKRPLSSLSPTIVLDGRRPELVVGGSGGPFIISGVLQVLLGVVSFGRDVETAVTAPRIHDQGTPAVLLAEPGVPEATRDELARSCHPVRLFPALGAVSAVSLGADRTLRAAGDPRKDGGAVVVR
jgi:gamma-glutamyltranspeptidase/glutathione hydrolase